MIDPGADSQSIIDQVAQCPSGALSIELKQSENNSVMENNSLTQSMLPTKDRTVKGTFVFIDKDGKEETKEGNIALCRCGPSKNKTISATVRTPAVILLRRIGIIRISATGAPGVGEDPLLGSASGRWDTMNK